MIENLSKAVKIPQLRNKILFTFAVLTLYRFLAHIPVPGVDTAALQAFFSSSQLFSFLNIFTGGGMSNLSIIALGVGPYISASIIIQLLTMVVPYFEELSKEGIYGRQKINQYTQALTLPIALLQAYSVYFLLRQQDLNGVSLLPVHSPFDLLVIIVTMVGGAFLLTWIGEFITERGIGNGMSIIIFAGILAGLPSGATGLLATIDLSQIFNILTFLAVSIVVIAGVVYINQAFRKVEVQYSSRVQGGKSYGGGSSFIPIKINQAGVIPIIFAVSLVIIPGIVAGYLQKLANPAVSNFGFWLAVQFQPSSIFYTVFYFLMVFVFTFFYTAVTFNPQKIADDIRNHGGFIPGIRPGRATVAYLKYIINRLTLSGGVFLGLIAVLPSIMQKVTGLTSLAVGGTGLLIVVSVVLETVRQLESQVVTREYESFAK